MSKNFFPKTRNIAKLSVAFPVESDPRAPSGAFYAQKDTVY